MLVLAKITCGAAGGYAEYLQGKTTAHELGDYYLKGGERVEAPGRWATGAHHFGLSPDQLVTGEQLHTLMDVRRPDNGEQLRRAGGSGQAVAAIDATFSAPKSVSATWALAGSELRARIEHAHEIAIDRALAYATRQVPMLRHRTGPEQVVHEKATGLIATSWRHTTARAVADQVPDPQLHSHVLLHAAVRRDGRLVAIDSRSWLVHQREVGAAYRTELARELTTIGFAVKRGTGRGGRYFELDGIPQPLLDRWSSRHAQVQAAIRQRLTDQQHALEETIAQHGPEAAVAAEQLDVLLQTGQLSPAQERLMGTITRSAKTLVTSSDLDSEWRVTALREGASRERTEVLRHVPGPRVTPGPATAAEVLEALTEFDATFKAREARAVALEQSAGSPISDALAQIRTLRNSGEIVLLADGTGTTLKHRGRERAVVAISERLAAATTEPIAQEEISREIRRLDQELAKHGGRLSDEQRAAIDLACGGRPLVVIEGQAGAGKNTALIGIARAHQASGREIIVTSTAALAAERLAAELTEQGVVCISYSTVGLDAAIRAGRVELRPETTVIHDEAALASTGEQLRLLRAVDLAGARVIEVGDPSQSQPVGAGGLWTRIETATRRTHAHAELTLNQRARDPADRRDQAHFRKGEIEDAIRGYAAREHVHFTDDRRRAEDKALEAAHADRATGKRTLVIAQTSNQHLDELNARAQAIRAQDGELEEDGIAVPGRPYELHAGDLIQIRRTITHADYGQLRNGATAEIVAVDAESRTVKLRLNDGTGLTLDETRIADADLRLAYVQHPFPAQGQTTDRAHLIVTDHTTRQGAYVGITRARQRTDLYAGHEDGRPTGAGRLARLAERLGRAELQMPSIEIQLTQAVEIADRETLESASTTTPALHVIVPALDEQTPVSREWPRPQEHGQAVRTNDEFVPWAGHEL